MKIKSIDEAVDIFIKSAIENFNLLNSEDHKLSNKHYKIMNQCVQFLNGNNSLEHLSPLLEYPNFGVQL